MSREADVYIVHHGKQAGPFSVAELKRQVASGNVSRDTMAWYKGLPEWTILSDAFSEDIEIPDTPRSRNGKEGLSLIRDDGLNTPPALPEGLQGKWAGPRAGGGRLFIPGGITAKSEEELSTPQWEKEEAKRVKRKAGGNAALLYRILAIAGIGVAIWLLW